VQRYEKKNFSMQKMFIKVRDKAAAQNGQENCMDCSDFKVLPKLWQAL